MCWLNLGPLILLEVCWVSPLPSLSPELLGIVIGNKVCKSPLPILPKGASKPRDEIERFTFFTESIPDSDVTPAVSTGFASSSFLPQSNVSKTLTPSGIWSLSNSA